MDSTGPGEHRNAGEETEFGDYTTLDLRMLRVESTLPFDLFIRVSHKPVLYRNQNLPFLEETRQNLITNNVTELYVHSGSAPELATYFERHLSAILHDSGVPPAEQARAITSVAHGVARDIIHDPERAKVKRVLGVAANVARFVLDSEQPFSRLLGLLSHRSTLEAHSANTSILAMALAPHLPESAMNPEFVANLALGGLLHDVGLTFVPTETLRKPGPLDEEEWRLVRQHPVTGEQILGQMGAYPQDVLRSVRMHHERLDGSGYPDGRRGLAIPWIARAVSIAEVFDNLTTAQPYRDRMDPYDALRVMLEEMGTGLDSRLVRAFIPELLGDPR